MVSSGKKNSKVKLNPFKQFINSVWFFPIILLIPLVVFTTFKISGSSIGYIHTILYGDIQKDPDLIANEPEGIRSDEWLVNTQETIMQAKDNFPEFNKDVGNGQDMSTVDVPYKNWSIIFKPHNLVFFVLPLENAFALKWWLMGYLLIVSCYFFVLSLLPNKKLIAASLALALFFSAFVQWWYAYGTLGTLYYSLFIATATLYLFRQKLLWRKILLGLIISYLLVCFVLVLYPPFQISCGLVLGTFLLGYFIQNYSKMEKKEFLYNLLILFGSIVVSLGIVGSYILTRSNVINTINNTVYPGTRSIESGGTYGYHFMSSNLGYQFISNINTSKYLIDGQHISNQSEASNFLLLIPFLFIPAVYLLYYDRKKKQKMDWLLLLLSILFLILLLEAFVPAFTTLSKLFLLSKVGGSRVLIGIGLLNLIYLVLFIKNYSKNKFIYAKSKAIIYSLIVLAIELVVGFHAYLYDTGFIRLRDVILFSIPIPLVIYLLIRKRFSAAILIYLLFSIFITYRVNPLYKGLSIVTDNSLSQAIQKYGDNNNKAWVSEGGYLENIALDNGMKSVSATYVYPQFSMWDTIKGANKFVYDRYAHVGVEVVNNPNQQTQLNLLQTDSFAILTSSCSQYLKSKNVGFIVTPVVLTTGCVRLVDKLSYPFTTIYIYSVNN